MIVVERGPWLVGLLPDLSEGLAQLHSANDSTSSSQSIIHGVLDEIRHEPTALVR